MGKRGIPALSSLRTEDGIRASSGGDVERGEVQRKRLLRVDPGIVNRRLVTLRKTIELLSSYIQHRVTDCLLGAGDCALGKLACHH